MLLRLCVWLAVPVAMAAAGEVVEDEFRFHIADDGFMYDQ